MENGKVANNLSAYYEKKKTPTVKSYRNADFLNSDAGRNIRIQCELEESKWRLSREGVHGKISCRLYWSCAVYSSVFIRWCVVLFVWQLLFLSLVLQEQSPELSLTSPLKI